MNDPRELRVGDRVRFVATPDEWAAPGHTLHAESRELMLALIHRGRACRVGRIAEDGYPWIHVRVPNAEGILESHYWGIYEQTGWRKVVPRSQRMDSD